MGASAKREVGSRPFKREYGKADSIALQPQIILFFNLSLLHKPQPPRPSLITPINQDSPHSRKHASLYLRRFR